LWSVVVSHFTTTRPLLLDRGTTVGAVIAPRSA
jgi:hypothetical protein